jgi:hypothetical protein
MIKKRVTASQIQKDDVIAGAVVERDPTRQGGIVYVTVSDMLGERHVMSFQPGVLVTVLRPRPR